MKKRPLSRSFNFVLLSVYGVLFLNVRGGRFADCKRDAGLCDSAFLHVRRAFVEYCAETVGTGQVCEHVDGVSCTQREIADIQRTAKRSFVIYLDRVDVLKLRVENLNRYDIFFVHKFMRGYHKQRRRVANRAVAQTENHHDGAHDINPYHDLRRP